MHAARAPAISCPTVGTDQGSHRPAGAGSPAARRRAPAGEPRRRDERRRPPAGGGGARSPAGATSARPAERCADRAAAPAGRGPRGYRPDPPGDGRRAPATQWSCRPPRPPRGPDHRRPRSIRQGGDGPCGRGAAVPRERMRIVSLRDRDYPARLKEIHDPPARLYVNGQLPSQPMIAIVGSRRATPYGQRTAHRLARDLSDAGVVVVSGLARGVDAAAHRGALEGRTPTVAVMATGLDRIYPPEHAELAHAIAAAGAVITEAAQRSGALITARMAAEQGREVFCVPGSIENPLAIGGHQLLKDGATLVQTVEDVLDEFIDLSRARTRAQAHTHARTRARARADSGPQDPELSAVWELLDWVEPRHHDDLAVMMNLDIKEVSRRLTLLEMAGYIIGDCGAVTRSPQD